MGEELQEKEQLQKGKLLWHGWDSWVGLDLCV